MLGASYYENVILDLLTNHFNGDRNEALNAYNNPAGFFRDRGGQRKSIREMVEEGRGEEILGILETVLR